MPCGGIYPVSFAENMSCWVCNELNCTHFVEEWDATIHESCIDKFLTTDEGKMILSHQHEIIRSYNG